MNVLQAMEKIKELENEITILNKIIKKLGVPDSNSVGAMADELIEIKLLEKIRKEKEKELNSLMDKLEKTPLTNIRTNITNLLYQK